MDRVRIVNVEGPSGVAPGRSVVRRQIEPVIRNRVSLYELLKGIVDIPNELGLPYMLTGSLAAAYHATPRATKDIDIVNPRA